MQTTVVTIPTELITDWSSFHSVFAEVFGFPGFYGRNMNAWVDCMTCLDCSESELSTVNVAKGDVVTIRIDDAPDFMRRCRDQYNALVECTAFVNYRRVEKGLDPVLALMFAGFFRDTGSKP